MGPEGGPADFVIAARCVDVKTSKARLRHFVSQTQVDRPMGDLQAYFASLWVGSDPDAGVRLPSLVERLLARSSDPACILKHLLQLGYSPADRDHYEATLLLLEEPHWFSVEAVPRVRVADPGVSHLRYAVTLDDTKALQGAEVAELRLHFHGHADDVASNGRQVQR